MALAGKQDRVARRSAPDGVNDALAAVFDACIVLPLGPADLFRAGRDLAEDRHGVLFPRVFIGEDGIVAEASRDLSHPWALLPVAIPGAAEDGDQLPPGNWAQLTKDLLQTLWRMGVIDDHRKRLTEINPLHATADSAVAFQPLADLVDCQTDGDARGGRGQRVGGIPAAAQLQP